MRKRQNQLIEENSRKKNNKKKNKSIKYLIGKLKENIVQLNKKFYLIFSNIKRAN